MAKQKYKPRAGEGAKAKILTKMIYPRRVVADAKDESEVVLVAEESKTINKKEQACYTFKLQDGEICHAIKRYVHVFEEGDESKVFDKTLPGPPKEDPSLERKVKWRKSEAKRLLYGFLIDGTVPYDGTMSVEDVYLLHEEFAKYDFDKFEGRLKRLQNKITELDNRADEDLAAFNNYKKNHKPSLFSHKGYVQWQGSTAQELLWDDLDDYLKDPTRKPKDLWLSRPEYMKEFPLDAFQEKIKQEIRTDKYVQTRAARARGEKV